MTRYDDDQRMTVTVAHARLNCVCTDTEVTTLVRYPQGK